MVSNEIKLFVIDKTQTCICYKKCKILINKITKQVIITPINEDIKPILLSFDRTFVNQRNKLGIFNSIGDPKNYILILPRMKSCKRIFDEIQKGKIINIAENDQNITKLLDILKLINVESNGGLSNVKKSFSQNHSLRSNKNQIGDHSSVAIDAKSNGELNSSGNKIIEAPNFKIIKNDWKKWGNTKLIIFPNEDKSQCYEYTWNKRTKVYNCLGCIKLNRTISSRICQNSMGEDYVNLLSTNHVCKIRKYNPEKLHFDSTQRIFDSSNYQIFNYSRKGIQRSTLVLFCPTNKNLCYEYFWNNRRQNYTCGSCRTERRATAVIFKNEKDAKEYLKLNKNEHICDLREVDLIKFKDDLMIQKPMYEIVERYVCGKKKKFLLIFTDVGKDYCYKLGYLPSEKCFHCIRCSYQTKSIRAFLTKKNGDERVYVSNKQHICSPIEYSSFIKLNNVKSPNFHLITRKVNQKIVKRLVVFDKTECYEYTWCKKHKKYICSPCKTQAHVFAKIYKNEENGEFVELCQKQHKCKPMKFVPEKNVKTVFEPNFEIDEYILGGIKRKRIKLFDKSDKNLCYYYYKETERDIYLCSTCHMKQKYVTAKLLHDETTNKNYLELNEAQHVCEPQKTTTITTIQKPNFKLEECIIDGFKRKFIIIFDKIDSTLCYKYCYFGTDKAYLCINCKKAERLVTARLKKDKSGEEYIALNKNEHICAPIKYNPKEFSTRILTTENFKQEIITVNGIEKKRLIINITTQKEKYYVYVYSSKDDFYICKNCKDRNASAKLLKNGNGEDYLEMGNKMHNNKCRALTKS